MEPAGARLRWNATKEQRKCNKNGGILFSVVREFDIIRTKARVCTGPQAENRALECGKRHENNGRDPAADEESQGTLYGRPASGLAMPISIGGVMQSITDSIERAVRQADRMMYQAKNRKNTVAVAGPDRENVKNGTQEAPQQARQQILIIDDSEMNRAILAAILRQDYRILEAANGEEGVEMINQHGGDIALVLLDLIMPVMDGFDVLDIPSRTRRSS